jgi:hypothetical protein
MLQALKERQIAMPMTICLKSTIQFLLSGPEMTPWYTIRQWQFLVFSMGASKVVYTIPVLMQQLVVATSASTCCSTSLTRKNQLSNKFQPVLLMTHYCFNSPFSFFQDHQWASPPLIHRTCAKSPASVTEGGSMVKGLTDVFQSNWRSN